MSRGDLNDERVNGSYGQFHGPDPESLYFVLSRLLSHPHFPYVLLVALVLDLNSFAFKPINVHLNSRNGANLPLIEIGGVSSAGLPRITKRIKRSS